MKKLLAALLACMTITCAFVSCGDSNESSKESKKSSSSSEKDDDKDDDEDDDEDESSEEEDEDSKEEKKSSKKDKDDESSEESEDESSEEEKKSDKKSKKKSDGGSATSEDIAGDWYSEEIGGCFSFHEDGNFSIKIDISDMMTIDEKGVAHMVGEDEDYSDYCTYDGETLVFKVDMTPEGQEPTEDTVFEMMTIKRKDGVNKDSAYGEYTLISGYIYDEFAEEVTDPGDKYSIIVGENELWADVAMSTYTTQDGKVLLDGEALEYFGMDSEEDAAFEYEIDGDELKLTSEGETLVLERQ
ncbi:MAG: hypothetical protein J6M48_09470 [Ruminococcus sp.]|nr:hypothetical protein [Ruminococcus sp.]